MKTIVLCKGRLETLPQIMSLALVTKELGNEVEVLTSLSEQRTKDSFAEKGIDIVDLYPELEIASSTALGKLKHWRSFAKGAWKYIDKNTEDVLLWASSADTALALGRKLLHRNYVLHIRELYDKIARYRRALAKYARQASCVVVPEISRACIFRCWYDLEETPIVLPNKPTGHPRKVKLEIEDSRARSLLEEINENAKLVLYQGGIYPERELRFIAEGVQAMGDDWRLVVMGSAQNNYLEELRKCSSKLVHIPNVLAPRHLQVTSHAYVGIVTYSYTSLNNIFCAPNKIWEYSGFGMPMLCSNLPPLQMTVQANGAGACVNTNDISQITSALKQIDDNYESFSRNAVQLYDSIDIHEIIQNVLDIARRNTKHPGAVTASTCPDC